MKKIFHVILLLFISFVVCSQDIDFGVFNYEGSRLTGMTRYRNKKLEQEIAYIYDKDGYLTERILTVPAGYKKKDVIYRSYIKYDLSSDIVTEKFDRMIGKRIVPMIYIYYYKDNKLVEVKRTDSNYENTIKENTEDIVFRYNEKNDLIYIEDKSKISHGQTGFFPGCGIALLAEDTSIFKYEYFPDKKIRFCLYENIFCKYNEFFYENNKLIKINQFSVDGKNFSSYSEFKYNNKNLIIETLYTYPDKDNKNDKKKITYEYDSKNRLIKRIIWFNRDGVNEIDEVENYYYQDGKYVYYPYLLPPKIKVYRFQAYESLLDKSVF